MTINPDNFQHIKHYKFDGEYYDFFAPDKFMLQEIRRRYQEFFHLFPLNPDQTILEIGTGGGFALEELEKTKPTFIPVDIPQGNLKNIRSKANGPTFPCCADAYQLPFKENSFDLIILAEVVEHLQDPGKVFKALFPLLKNDGKLLISVPYKEEISYQICVHCHQPTPTHSHFHSFDEQNLSGLLKSAGFKPLKISKNCNKLPNRLHFNLITKNIPFPIWKFFDRFFNLLLDKPISLIALSKRA
jgi:2-polyprenyl-3-methyl-5-hydroxy-6-metoxy-1,4-benzoquinol methylase